MADTPDVSDVSSRSTTRCVFQGDLSWLSTLIDRKSHNSGLPASPATIGAWWSVMETGRSQAN